MGKEENFKVFYSLIFSSINAFFVRVNLLKEKNTSGFNMRPSFWLTVIDSLKNKSLLDLANLFDEDARVLSINSYMEYLNDSQKKRYKKLLSNSKYKEIIKNLTVRRNNHLAHKSSYYLSNSGKLTEKFPIKFEQIEDLFKVLIRIMNSTKKNFDVRDATNYIIHYPILKKKCKQDTAFVLKNGLNTPEYNKLHRIK